MTALHTLFGTFRWIWVLGLLLGLAGGYFFWEENERIAAVDRQGAEAVAQVIQVREQSSGGQNKRTSYWADVRWRDQTGALRLHERIPVSGTFARRVTKDGRLVQSQTRIKYLPGRPDVRPLLVEDGAHNGWQTPIMMWVSLAFAAFSVFLWAHMLRFERRADRKPSDKAAPTAA
jgi:uncharacterized protein DUF3592